VPLEEFIEDKRSEQEVCGSELAEVDRALTRLLRLTEARRSSPATSSAATRLDRSAYGLLSRLEELPATRLTELAAALEIDLSTASRQIRALEERGFVSRTDDPCDQRTGRLELTELGRTTLCTERAFRVERIAARLSTWQRQEVEDLARLLARLVDNFTGPDVPAATTLSAPSPLVGAAR
jgi:DNA-binding MarR family transcriptional regulator